MNVELKNTPLNGTLTAPDSKSALHRILICSALSDNESTVITASELSEDIRTTVSCLKSMGAEIEIKNNTLSITPLSKQAKKPFTLSCNQSGSTLRFLLPVCASLGRPFTVTGNGRLPERPIDESIRLLKENGCTVHGDRLPLKIDGRLHGNNFYQDGTVSSQFISGLMLASPLLNGETRINIVNGLNSENYVDITADIMKIYGITATKQKNGITVTGKYHSPGTVTVPKDWTNASYFLTAGAINGSVTVNGLDLNSSQGDKEIINILKKCGANVKIRNGSITVSNKEINHLTVDAENISDLVGVLAVLLSLGNGTGRIINAGRLRFKESDRLYTISESLNRIGAKITATKDELIINPVKQFKGGVTDGFNDHRIVMALAVAALKSENPVIITGAECVKKSYPDFFKDYNTAGGSADVIHNG